MTMASSQWPPPPPVSSTNNDNSGRLAKPGRDQAHPGMPFSAPPPPTHRPISAATTDSFAAMNLGRPNDGSIRSFPPHPVPTASTLPPPPPRLDHRIGTIHTPSGMASTTAASVAPPPRAHQTNPPAASPFPPPPTSMTTSNPPPIRTTSMVSPPPPPPSAVYQQHSMRSQPPVYGSGATTNGGGPYHQPPPLSMQQSAAPPPPPTHPSYPAPPPVQTYPKPPPSSTIRPPPTTVTRPPPPIPTNHGGQPGLPPPRQKIDPAQIPRPPLFTRPQQHDTPVPVYYTRRELNGLPPPDADSRFVCCDDGNAAPDYIRSSVYKMPVDRGVWRKTGLCELGLLCTPLAHGSMDHVPRQRVLPLASEEERNNQQQQEASDWTDPMRVPVDFSTLDSGDGPPRCSRCQAYANPFWNGTTCNFCNHKNNRRDIASSSAMAFNYGTLEYAVGGPYVTRDRPVEPMFLYAVDATCPNVSSYVPLLQSVGVSLAQHVRRQGTPYVKPPRIGVCLVGAFGVVLVNSSRNQNMEVAVMPDVTVEPFCPLPLDEWTQDLSTEEGLEQWINLMNGLLDVWKPFLDSLDQTSANGQTSYAFSCGGAALAFLGDALSETGGRGTWLSWRRPNFGVGAIRDREAHKMEKYSREALERTLYMPLQLQSNKDDEKTALFYKTLGETCAKNRVTLDVMLHSLISPSSFLDIGTLSELCRITCGKVKWIRSRDWKEHILEELRRPTMSFSGSDAVFKVRCSDGMRVKSFMSGTAPGVTVDSALSDSFELELSTVMPDTSIAIVLEHKIGGLLQNTPMMYYQSALLYTASCGQRRVRVSTLGVQTSSNVADVFRSVDFTATMSLIVREAVASVWKTTDSAQPHFKAARDEITRRCVDILACYRRHTPAHASPPGQLILPDRLKLLPLFCMSLLKSTMFRPCLPKRGSGHRATHPSPNADERSFALFYGASISPTMSMLTVHPYVLPLINLEDGAGDWQAPDTSRARSDLEMAACQRYIQLPASTHPSIAALEEEGVYLVDDGFTIFVYFGIRAHVTTKNELLTMDESGCNVSVQSESGRRIHRLIWQMRTFSAIGQGSESNVRPTYPPVVVVLANEAHRDPFEEVIMKALVDDPTSSEHNYPEYLCELHKHVRNQVETGTPYKPA